ncbi:hypothetical protein P691DRAFT_774931 [Macrolepiota fuliginosa MF-IS2]|uniref:non-specific serine/threonine protein kinase n=1 Tax=Macrolepiota fuliginosa MF-IS2 TaxID=1400762 RepID=A0A9P5XEX5_9AGAR|nr:hypothetical protein P691DRAFT_774931 [Macrolepiota fuliginosa MF-IS2]
MASMLRPSLQLRVSNLESHAPSSTLKRPSFDMTTSHPSTTASPASIRSTQTDSTMDSSHTTGCAIGIHRGAIDNTTITTRPPREVITKVRDVLDSIGVCVQPESTFKFRCIRPSQSSSESQPSAEGFGPQSSLDITTNTIYASDPSRDPAGEVRFSVELTRLAGLNDTYSLDIRRLKGNLRSYQFLYETIRDRAQLTA